ncbi:hypothetical protein ACFYOK_18160 [Microbispora bryophytorum]|uniref:PIN domain-containing protein n=1 Tax=Microbispora bryophytorum TaxID=1460882 RepID=UPI0033F29F7A
MKKKTGLHPGRAWANWFADDANWDILIRCTVAYTAPLDRDTLIEALDKELARRQPLFPWRTLSSDERHLRATNLVDATIEMLIPSLDPAYAVAVASHSTQLAIADLKRSLNLALDPQDQYQRVPPAVAEALSKLHGTQPDTASRLLDVISQSSAPLETARSLTASPPLWLRDPNPLVFVLLGELASAHGDWNTAGFNFQAAADSGFERARYMAKAAIAAAQGDDHPRAEEPLGKLESPGTPQEIYEFTKSLISNDIQALVRFIDIQEPWDPTVLSAAAEAFLSLDPDQHLDRALRMYERLVRKYPNYTALKIRLADLMVESAIHRRDTDGWEMRREATRLAISSRDSRRLWKGDSSKAVAIACRAAAIDDRWDEVLLLGLRAPKGQATQEEASDGAVVRVVVEALLICGRLEDAEVAISEVTDSVVSQILSGALAAARGNDNLARQHYLDAWPLIQDEQDRLFVWSALAAYGDELPGRELLESRADAAANFILARHELARGDIGAGISRLRQWRHKFPEASYLLASTYANTGRIEEALAELRFAAGRFSDASYLLTAAKLCLNRDRIPEAKELAERALLFDPASPDLQITSYEILISCAQRTQDWPGMAARTSMLIERHGATPDRRWLLVGALFNQSLFSEAWNELTAEPKLEASSDIRAMVWVDLHAKFAPGSETASKMLALTARYDSPEFVAATIGRYTMMAAKEQISPEVADQWRSRISNFLENNPGHPGFFAIPVPDAPEDFIEALRPHLEPRAKDISEMKRAAASGSAPCGLLAVYAGKPYAATLIQYGPGCLPIQAPGDDHLQREVAYALAAIDGASIADTSSLVVLGFLGDRWRIVQSALARLLFPIPSRSDISKALVGYEQPVAGLLGWNTEAGIPSLVDITEAERVRWRERAESLLEKADSLEPVNVSNLSSIFPDKTNDSEPVFLPWLAALEYAIRNNVALYADDIALRTLARENGIPSFGTIAMLHALATVERISAAELISSIDELRYSYCVDLPLDQLALSRIAARDAWKPGAASYAFSRPAAWTLWDKAIAAWQSLCSKAGSHNPIYVAGWLNHAVLGACQNRSINSVPVIAAYLICKSIFIVGGDREVAPELISAARAALSTSAALDPLPFVVEMLLKVFQQATGNIESAARLVLAILENLNDQDRAIVRSKVFSVR